MRGMIFIGILVVGILILGGLVPGGFMPEEDMGYLMVNIQLPDAASLQRSDVVAKKVEKIIENYKEVEFITTATGFSLLSGSMSSNAGFIFVSLKDWSERNTTAREVVDRLNKDFASQILEAQVFAFGPPPIPGFEQGLGVTGLRHDVTQMSQVETFTVGIAVFTLAVYTAQPGTDF